MFDPGKESTLVALGRTWRTSRLEVRVVFGFRDYIRSAMPADPFADVERLARFLPAEEVVRRVREIDARLEQLEKFTLQCPLAKEHMATEAGGARFVQLLLEKHQPDVTLEEALQVALELGQSRMGQVVAAAAGQSPGGNGGGPAVAEPLSPGRIGS